MHIIVKKNGPESRKLSHSEKQDLMQRKEELESQLGSKESEHLLQDRGKLKDNLDKVKDQLESDEDNRARGAQKDVTVTRIKELDEQIQHQVNPIVCKQVNAGTAEYEKAIEAAWEASEPAVTALVDERRNLKRFLDPENPDAGSLESIVKGETKL